MKKCALTGEREGIYDGKYNELLIDRRLSIN